MCDLGRKANRVTSSKEQGYGWGQTQTIGWPRKCCKFTGDSLKLWPSIDSGEQGQDKSRRMHPHCAWEPGSWGQWGGVGVITGSGAQVAEYRNYLDDGSYMSVLETVTWMKFFLRVPDSSYGGHLLTQLFSLDNFNLSIVLWVCLWAWHFLW